MFTALFVSQSECKGKAFFYICKLFRDFFSRKVYFFAKKVIFRLFFALKPHLSTHFLFFATLSALRFFQTHF